MAGGALAAVLAGGPACLVLQTMPVRAQAADPAAEQIQGFYEALTASMKSGGTAKSRYEKLEPAV